MFLVHKGKKNIDRYIMLLINFEDCMKAVVVMMMMIIIIVIVIMMIIITLFVCWFRMTLCPTPLDLVFVCLLFIYIFRLVYLFVCVRLVCLRSQPSLVHCLDQVNQNASDLS